MMNSSVFNHQMPENWEDVCIEKLTIADQDNSKVQNQHQRTISQNQTTDKKNSLTNSQTNFKFDGIPLISDLDKQKSLVIDDWNDCCETQKKSTSDSSISSEVSEELLQALQNPKERRNVLLFEQQIKKFMENTTEQDFFFPPLTSYQRFVVHRLADRFDLIHQAAKMGSSENHGIHLSKKPTSKIPDKLLFQIASEQNLTQQNQEKAQPKILIKSKSENQLKPKTQHSSNNRNQKNHSKVDRKENDQKNSVQGSQGNNSLNNKQIKTVDQRQKEYDDVRARIFQSQKNSESERSLQPQDEKKLNEDPLLRKSDSRRKVEWRDHEAEKSDPDFCRHSISHRSTRSSGIPSMNYPVISTPFIPFYKDDNYGYSSIPIQNQPNFSSNNIPTMHPAQYPQQHPVPPLHPFYQIQQPPSYTQSQQFSSNQYHVSQHQMLPQNIGSNQNNSHQTQSSFTSQSDFAIYSRSREKMDQEFPPLQKKASTNKR